MDHKFSRFPTEIWVIGFRSPYISQWRMDHPHDHGQLWAVTVTCSGVNVDESEFFLASGAQGRGKGWRTKRSDLHIEKA